MSTASADTGGPVDIDGDVDLLTEQIQALKELGRRGDVDEGEIYDFSIRWGATLSGRLGRLVHYDSLGLLHQADQRRFHSLCDELRSLSGLIDRFGIAAPEFGTTPPGRVRRVRPLPASLRRGLLRHR